MDSYNKLMQFAQHYCDNDRIIRSTRGTNMTAINLGKFHIEASNSDDNPSIFCDLYHDYRLVHSCMTKDVKKLHTDIDHTITTFKENAA